jgi:hypothetical protein
VQRERRGGPDWPWRSNAIASQWIARACEKADNLDMLIPDMLAVGELTQRCSWTCSLVYALVEMSLEWRITRGSEVAGSNREEQRGRETGKKM